MKRLILISLLLFSCSKPIQETQIEMVFVVWMVYCGKEPTHAVITTDKGVFIPELYKREEGSYGVRSWGVDPDIYVLKDVTLNNDDGVTHYMAHGYDERATSWVDDFEYDLTYDRKFVFSVFCND